MGTYVDFNLHTTPQDVPKQQGEVTHRATLSSSRYALYVLIKATDRRNKCQDERNLQYSLASRCTRVRLYKSKDAFTSIPVDLFEKRFKVAVKLHEA